MAGLCEGGNESPGSLKAIFDYFKAKYQLEDIEVIGLLIGARGVIPKFFERFRKTFELPQTLTADIITSVEKKHRVKVQKGSTRIVKFRVTVTGLYAERSGFDLDGAEPNDNRDSPRIGPVCDYSKFFLRDEPCDNCMWRLYVSNLIELKGKPYGLNSARQDKAGTTAAAAATTAAAAATTAAVNEILLGR
ncbi:hypothetical protein ANN_16158 [Periplaneta americana]|uniref:Uncharacterized protein n=1 Tax=Periplaneta americana TaxID=6978 RepID=A0ABQ8SJ54_PERAM|nr:hypothetical protein ANN_16158 [Periplaneta americana]